MNSAEGLALVARVVGGLVIVLVLIAISAKIARRTRHFGGGTDLEIIDRLGISRDNQLAVVRVAGRHLLLGIGPQGVSMLSHLDDASPAPEPGAPVVPAPEVAPAPLSISDLPEDIAAELVAQFEAAAQLEAAQAEAARFEAARFEAVARAEGDGSEQPLRRPRRRHAAPGEPDAVPGEPDSAPAAAAPPAAELPEIPEVRLPGALNLGDYPDLASALRAAGRTTTSPSRHGQSAETDRPGSSSWIPAQRQGSRAPDLSQATSSAPVTSETSEAPRTSRTSEATAATAPEPEAEAAGRRRGRARRVPQQGQVQASGSVLSPATWRQGIEALRELTVRRG